MFLSMAAPVSAFSQTVYDYDRDAYARRYEYDDRNHHSRNYSTSKAVNADTNSCLEGSIIGGLLGAGVGAVLSRGNGRWAAVPFGGAAGALLGCQVDGG